MFGFGVGILGLGHLWSWSAQMCRENSIMNLFKNDALENKTYLVTGASSGIGRATAMLLAECGARVL